MIYPHQQQAIAYITDKFKADPTVDALLISGSISHGFNDEKSDVDINMVVSRQVYEEKAKARALTYFEGAGQFYEGGYFDGKYITLDYLELIQKKGNEPTRFALHDCRVVFDRTGQVQELLQKIATYDTQGADEKAIRFLSQLDAWKWYCDEALKKNNLYLLDLSVSKLILFAGRLILLENRIFFPYHKWFLRVLEGAANKPNGLMDAIESLQSNKSADNITRLYELVKNHKDWSNGVPYSWPHYFVTDVETVWMRQDEFIENI